ncbi:MAG: hypothetical protein AAB508_02180 [Patescibacteria group bacterium]
MNSSANTVLFCTTLSRSRWSEKFPATYVPFPTNLSDPELVEGPVLNVPEGLVIYTPSTTGVLEE